MITYSWKTVLRQSNKSSLKIVQIVDYLTYRPIPWDANDINYLFAHIDWSGSSFLLRPEPLLRLRYGSQRKWNIDIAHYVGLASLRNQSEYLTMGTLSLDLLACEGKEELINNNSLLQIVDNRVLFKYEEAPNGETKWH